MQIYLKPYPHNTYTNVPYAPVKGTQNIGYLDAKKYPGKVKSMPELRIAPQMVDLIQRINRESKLTTFGCDVGADSYAETHSGIFTKWSFINMFFAELDDNKLECDYYLLVSDFMKQFSGELSDNLIVEFIINPTNFHDFNRFKKGVKPSEKTVMFVGHSLNLKVMGAGVDQLSSVFLWETGLNMVADFLCKDEKRTN